MADTTPPRQQLVELFTDPRRLRADLRRYRSWLTRGRLSRLPHAEQDSLAERFVEAQDRVNATRNVETMTAGLAVIRALFSKGAPRGRPRVRESVLELPRFDAWHARRYLTEQGVEIPVIAPATVKIEGTDTDHRVELVTPPGCRSYWKCPRCGTRCRYLHQAPTGPGCRACWRLTYPQQRRRR